MEGGAQGLGGGRRLVLVVAKDVKSMADQGPQSVVSNVLILKCFQNVNFLLKQEMHASLLLMWTLAGLNQVVCHAKLVISSALMLSPSEKLIGTNALLAQCWMLLVTT